MENSQFKNTNNTFITSLDHLSSSLENNESSKLKYHKKYSNFKPDNSDLFGMEPLKTTNSEEVWKRSNEIFIIFIIFTSNHHAKLL